MSENAAAEAVANSSSFTAPHPGSQKMPRWDTGELIPAPVFTWRNWFAMLGPGLVMGGSAIGGGEWLLGPRVTAVYGGSLLWLATFSILGQVLYNIEISRYTLYCGEPIFTGKFRTLPGPRFWVVAYLLLDMGTIFPYLAADAATPVATILKGGVIPSPDKVASDWYLMKGLGMGIFLLALVPLLFGGKIYNSIKAIMTTKIFVVFGFLILTALLYSQASTWWEIVSGFFKIGTIPVADGPHAGAVDNVLVALWEGRGLTGNVDFKLVAFICGLAAIAGNGGLSNTPISNYTREQGWGMGHHVGAIPSVIGGHNIQLSHVGCVFEAKDETLPRWRRWYRHVARDQLCLWMPACFIGLALPSMLSVQFLPRGTQADAWTAAAMTAGGVHQHVTSASGALMGNVFWFMILFCGFLVLAPGVASTADGFIRRWVDVFWTSSGRLRQLEPHKIKQVYFCVLLVYAAFGLTMLSINKPSDLITYSTMIYNVALGFSCWHVLALNLILLPRPLRPRWFVRIALALTGAFFMILGVVAIAAVFLLPK
jgi:hypothetical protein